LSFEGNDLIVFETSESAEAFVEPPDVEVAETYDASGQVLRFETDGRSTKLTETHEVRPDALRAALLKVFAATDELVIEDASLPDLVATATERYRYSGRRFFWGHARTLAQRAVL
jgi:hypothetical protein